jgi:hypothetical protein
MNVNAACRQKSENPTQSIPRHFACAETWVGNNQTASVIELPGLTAWVHSVPAARLELATSAVTARFGRVTEFLRPILE